MAGRRLGTHILTQQNLVLRDEEDFEYPKCRVSAEIRACSFGVVLVESFGSLISPMRMLRFNLM